MHPVSLTMPNAVMAATLTKKVGISTGIPQARLHRFPCASNRPVKVTLTGSAWPGLVEREPGMLQGWEGAGFINGNFPGFLESREAGLARTMLTDGSGLARAAVSG